MAKKTPETKKPDMMLTAFHFCVDWLTNNMRTAVIGGVVIVCLVLAGWGLAVHQARKAERANYTLFQGMRSFEEYSLSGKGDGLSKAEASFRSLLKSSPAGVKDVAKLYLARIAVMKGKPEEAKTLYAEVAKKPANDVVKKLSESSLQALPKK
jgi:predicted negative regulator of RcsB-dependent stress response